MLVESLFDPFSIAILVITGLMTVVSLSWWRIGVSRFERLRGGLQVLRRVGRQLAMDHPIRKRLESAPVVDLSFEEIARLMTGDRVEPTARALIELQTKMSWIERFAQFSTHLGILGTVYALVTSDPTDLDAFRASLPTALGTTFWGLVGALVLSAIAGACDTLFERARQHVREALLEGFEVERPVP